MIVQIPEQGCFLTGIDKGPQDIPSLGCLAQVVVSIISFALGLLGALTIIFFLLGCLRLVISRGDAKGLEGAKKTITYALMGFFLVFFSLLIINFVSTSLGLGNILTKFTLYIGSGAPGSTSGTGSGGSNPGGGNPGGGGGGGGSGFN